MHPDAAETRPRRALRGRAVVKVGSSVLTSSSGRLSRRALKRIADDVAPLLGSRLPCIVSSGAIAVGVGALGLKERPRTMAGLQAAAAVGQSKLVDAWGRALRPHGATVAQVLLTHADLADRTRFLNARRALGELERRHTLPVVNENDTVSFEEIAFGDNDRLAAQVANLVDADVLVLVTVSDGLLDAEGRRVGSISAFDPRLDGWVRPVRSRFGTGGMATKLEAVRIAAERGAVVAIIDGRRTGALSRLLAGEDEGTVFWPTDDRPLRSRAHWIAHTLRPSGRVEVDQGAVRALEQGRSLLPSGVVGVQGAFRAGDCVDVAGPGGRPVARGLVRYASADLDRIKGASSRRIGELLGFTSGDAVIHRDDLVISRSKGAQ
jgi:glutamate 5-kinase